jgi:hypothetical protein
VRVVVGFPGPYLEGQQEPPLFEWKTPQQISNSFDVTRPFRSLPYYHNTIHTTPLVKPGLFDSVRVRAVTGAYAETRPDVMSG